ncbi:hypothetical protein BDQ17DRAFT_1507263 [Cyathus striatus]|nr:hypothetical protein BDQ17DRAFT_1507263 [Cyathus striatus]
MSFTKINVAVAGVTNGLGHAIATELIANPSVNTVTLLTRASPSSPVPEVLKPLVKQGAIFQPVDYSSVEDITKVLQDVHAVISTMFTPSDITPAINLIDSAKAAGVKRFAPSEMAFSKEANYIIEDYKSKLPSGRR